MLEIKKEEPTDADTVQDINYFIGYLESHPNGHEIAPEILNNHKLIYILLLRSLLFFMNYFASKDTFIAKKPSILLELEQIPVNTWVTSA